MQSALNRSCLPLGKITVENLAWALSRLEYSARRVLGRAYDEAYHRRNGYVGSLHVLQALVSDDSDPLVGALRGRGAGPETITASVDHILGSRRTPRYLHLPYGPNAAAIVFHAACRAEAAAGATPGHLWWALSRSAHSRAGALLFNLHQLDYLQRQTQ